MLNDLKRWPKWPDPYGQGLAPFSGFNPWHKGQTQFYETTRRILSLCDMMRQEYAERLPGTGLGMYVDLQIESRSYPPGLFLVIREKKRLKPQPRIAQALDFRR